MTETTTRSRPRRLALAALAVTATCTLSACQITSPITTDLDYDPADGLSVDTEFVEGLDLLIVSQGDGAPGVLTGYIVNSGPEPITVEFALEVDGQRQPLQPEVEIQPGDAARTDGRTSNDDEFTNPVTIESVPVIAGSLVTVRMTTSAEGTVSKRIPVLPPDGVFAPYREVISSLR
ncbi:MAG: hypothetical protein WBG36_12945 [Ornithinimicrobium sp.]